MANQSQVIDGQLLAKLCKNTLPSQNDELLLQKIQQAFPDYPIHLAKTGDEWYNIGGVVTQDGKRVAGDLIEWTERTYIECGKNLQTLIDYALEQNLIATRETGVTLYIVAKTGKRAEQFVLIEIDKTHEASDRLLVNEMHPPEDLEDFIDPLEPERIEAYCFGSSRYIYRRKTDIALFMQELQQHHVGKHPAQRFMDDWNRSSASQNTTFSDDWIIRPYQHTGRYGEQILNAEIVNTQPRTLPYLEDIAGKKGSSLNNLLIRFDRQAGYAFAWFFYMVKGKLVSPHSGEAVYRDISGDFAYLPERDVTVLKDWIAEPYSV
ncbi:MAG: hypothetical protein ACU837_03345 [Gammaproteobacteria bacterium]